MQRHLYSAVQSVGERRAEGRARVKTAKQVLPTRKKIHMGRSVSRYTDESEAKVMLSIDTYA